MNPGKPSERLIELIDNLQANGSLHDTDASELESLLIDDENAREYFVLTQELHTMLESDKAIRLSLAADLMPDNVIPLPGIDVSEVLPDPPINIETSGQSSKANGYRLATSLAAMVAGLAVLIWIYSETSEFVEKTSSPPSETVIADSVNRISFHREVLPILKDNCLGCHGENAEKRKADLRLDSAKSTLSGTEPVVIPGQPGQSDLIARISSLDSDYRMPPIESGERLSDGQIKTLTKWVEQGADYGSEWSLSEMGEVDLWLAELCD